LDTFQLDIWSKIYCLFPYAYILATGEALKILTPVGVNFPACVERKHALFYLRGQKKTSLVNEVDELEEEGAE
jgi:hypothetical protein